MAYEGVFVAMLLKVVRLTFIHTPQKLKNVNQIIKLTADASSVSYGTYGASEYCSRSKLDSSIA